MWNREINELVEMKRNRNERRRDKRSEGWANKNE